MSDFAFTPDQGAITDLLEGRNGLVARDLTRRVLRVNTAAKRACPVDTGRLRASVTWEVGTDRQGLVGVVGTNVHYAPYVELGTSRMAAQPFLRPALRAAS